MIADALSRNPVFDPPTDNSTDMALCYGISPRDPLLRNVYEAEKKDLNYQKIVAAIQRQKLCSKLIIGHPGKMYKNAWEELSVINDTILVFLSTRLVIPESLRRSILDQLQTSHSGITRTPSLARKLYFLPGMSTQIADLINACDKCQNLRPSLKSEPLPNLQKPSEPMQTVSKDLHELKGINYICMCDRYSFFCWVSHLTTLRTVTVVKVINGWFKTIGYPQYIYLDNGPQFDSKEFKNYCDSHFIIPLNSSPLYAQSNGLSEAAVKAVKYLLIKSDNFADFEARLYELQAVSSAGKTTSPAELFYKRSF
jgi:hypothetical protein